MNSFTMNDEDSINNVDEYIQDAPIHTFYFHRYPIFFQIMHNTLELHGKESGQIWHRKGTGKHGYSLFTFF